MKVRKQSPDGDQKFLQHIKIPVHIMSSNANPISYQKNFKEDESNNYAYNSILMNRNNVVNNNLSLEPSLSKIKTIKKKSFANSKDNVMTSPINRLSNKPSTKFEDVGSKGPAVTSLRDSKASPRTKFVNDSANEVDTITRKDTDYPTHQESETKLTAK